MTRDKDIGTNQAIVQAAAAVLLDAVLRLMQDDPHSWSERGCETCRAIGSIVGKPFGCYVYAQQRAAARAKAQT
jgi:hypothetical protein